jgi:hypothetical protein
MSKKVYIKAKVKLILTVDDNADIDEVMMNLNITSEDDSGDVSDYEFKEWKVTDSK